MGMLDKQDDIKTGNEEILAEEPIIASEAVEEPIVQAPPVAKKADVNSNPVLADSETVEFTQSVTFNFSNKLYKQRVGDVLKVSKELRDVLLTRGCVRIKPL